VSAVAEVSDRRAATPKPLANVLDSKLAFMVTSPLQHKICQPEQRRHENNSRAPYAMELGRSTRLSLHTRLKRAEANLKGSWPRDR
jgi:hypothetical protein